jgi:hypothetical protein
MDNNKKPVDCSRKKKREPIQIRLKIGLGANGRERKKKGLIHTHWDKSLVPDPNSFLNMSRSHIFLFTGFELLRVVLGGRQNLD